MSRRSNLQLPFVNWPLEDQQRWATAFKEGDLFDNSRGAHLAASTKNALRVSYTQYLKFVVEFRADLLALSPAARISREMVAEYVQWLKKSYQDAGVVITLHHLRLALRLICPDSDWSWLLTITKRLAAAAPRKPRKYNQITSERLYLLGIELMDDAAAQAEKRGTISKGVAMNCRDGLLIAMLATLVPRRRTVAALRIGKHLVRAGQFWALDVPGSDMKSKEPMDAPIAPEISRRIDVFLDRFRRRIPAAEKHDGLWPSNKGRPLSANQIYATVRKRTKNAFGFAVNLHRFRHSAGSLWSVYDPANVRGLKDLLGHSSFEPTERFYIMGQSRIAGRAVAHAIDRPRE
jgi:integrase/recombinase XerD